MAQDVNSLGAVGEHRLDGRITIERQTQVDHLAVELCRHDIANLARAVTQDIADTSAAFDGAAGSIHGYRYLGTHREVARCITMKKRLMIAETRKRSAAVRMAGESRRHCSEDRMEGGRHGRD